MKDNDSCFYLISGEKSSDKDCGPANPPNHSLRIDTKKKTFAVAREGVWRPVPQGVSKKLARFMDYASQSGDVSITNLGNHLHLILATEQLKTAVNRKKSKTQTLYILCHFNWRHCRNPDHQ